MVEPQPYTPWTTTMVEPQPSTPKTTIVVSQPYTPRTTSMVEPQAIYSLVYSISVSHGATVAERFFVCRAPKSRCASEREFLHSCESPPVCIEVCGATAGSQPGLARPWWWGTELRERLACSPPITSNWAQYPAGSLSDFRNFNERNCSFLAHMKQNLINQLTDEAEKYGGLKCNIWLECSYSKPESYNDERPRKAFKKSNVPIYNVHDIEESVDNLQLRTSGLNPLTHRLYIDIFVFGMDYKHMKIFTVHDITKGILRGKQDVLREKRNFEGQREILRDKREIQDGAPRNPDADPPTPGAGGTILYYLRVEQQTLGRDHSLPEAELWLLGHKGLRSRTPALSAAAKQQHSRLQATPHCSALISTASCTISVAISVSGAKPHHETELSAMIPPSLSFTMRTTPPCNAREAYATYLQFPAALLLEYLKDVPLDARKATRSEARVRVGPHLACLTDVKASKGIPSQYYRRRQASPGHASSPQAELGIPEQLSFPLIRSATEGDYYTDLGVSYNSESLRADEGEPRWVRSSTGMKRMGKTKKTCQPVASSGTIATRGNPGVTRPGMEHVSIRREARCADDHEDSIDENEHEDSDNVEDDDGDFLDEQNLPPPPPLFFKQLICCNDRYEEGRGRREYWLPVCRSPE
ncbi:hypothetical protein PR048_001982 [Dryococelus australis]|uniref:Uncharacterized protein n=1 Tax=Dryococelus australis TaxID=614101 RepID=A0ABQ9IIW4_9NEOP|nr:hypothetical protein PR048_001982 [Dryococelus australis]